MDVGCKQALKGDNVCIVPTWYGTQCVRRGVMGDETRKLMGIRLLGIYRPL